MSPAGRRAVVAGIGMTKLSRESGRTTLQLARDVCESALGDAGVAIGAVDAALTYHLNDAAPLTRVLAALGVTSIGWHHEYRGGGTYATSVLGEAARLVETGAATTVLVYRALNGRSGRRMGGVALPDPDDPDAEFVWPAGLRGPVNLFALACQRWLYETGLGERDMAAVVLASRRAARSNPRAIRREDLDLDGYLASPMVSAPLRRADCCQETDGGCALVVTTLDRARDLPHSPVVIDTVLRGGGDGASDPWRAADPSRIFTGHLAAPFWAAAGVRPADVDVALLYDAYSYVVLQQLADLGFAPVEECAPRLGDGDLGVVVNPHGGLLSEGYVHGMNNVIEAVRQLRGTGTNQVPAAEVALCSGFGGSFGSLALLRRHDG